MVASWGATARRRRAAARRAGRRRRALAAVAAWRRLDGAAASKGERRERVCCARRSASRAPRPLRAGNGCARLRPRWSRRCRGVARERVCSPGDKGDCFTSIRAGGTAEVAAGSSRGIQFVHRRPGVAQEEAFGHIAGVPSAREIQFALEGVVHARLSANGVLSVSRLPPARRSPRSCPRTRRCGWAAKRTCWRGRARRRRPWRCTGPRAAARRGR